MRSRNLLAGPRVEYQLGIDVHLELVARDHLSDIGDGITSPGLPAALTSFPPKRQSVS
jgi:hypothetical protein